MANQKKLSLRQCRIIDCGHDRWLFAAVSSCFLAMMMVFGWLTILPNDAFAQNRQSPKQLQAPKPAKEEKLDLTGEIRDQQNAPVAGAKVLLIHKSWPGGRYRQDALHTCSDKEGNFRFADLYSTTTQMAFLVTVLAEGQTMQSEYVLRKPNEKVETFRFRLKPALDKTFVLQGQDGKPLANARVFPSNRKPAKADEPFLIYHQSATAAARKTDDNGSVRLPFFETGDTVELQVVDGEPITLVVDQSDRQAAGSVKRNATRAEAGRWFPPSLDVDESQVQWVRKHAVPFRLVVDDSDDFADLVTLKSLIGNSRIVQLGEQSHGDGSCFEAKIRLIRFLHRQMGFDVLAFESGLYDCDRANASFRNGVAPLQAAREGVFSIWTGCSQIAPLWTDLAASYKMARPLELAGFDCQFTSEASAKHLVEDLKAIATKYHVLKSADVDGEEWRGFFSQLQRLTTHEPIEGSKRNWTTSLDALIAGLEKVNPTGDADKREWDFWRQQLRSLKAYARYTFSESTTNAAAIDEAQLNRRDAQMAENLIWLADQHYRGRKIIVWAASFHILRNAARIEVPDGSVDYTSIVPMGHLVHQKLGKDVFTIAFTAAEGAAGAWFRPPFSIGDAPSGTFENICARAGLQHAIIPLRGNSPDSAWLSEELFARPLGYGWMKARWSDHFDAIVFQHTMQPATPNR